MLIEYLVISGNSGYYYTDVYNDNWSNHKHSLMELDAQKFAIEELYKYCKDLYNDDNLSKRLVLDVIKKEAVSNEFYDFGEHIINFIRYGNYYIDLNNMDFTYENVIKAYDEEIYKCCNQNLRRYISIDDFDNCFNGDFLYKYINEHRDIFVKNNINFFEYFKTSSDVDKFVICVTNSAQKEIADGRGLQQIIHNIGCLDDSEFVWNDGLFLKMFKNNEPNYQFSISDVKFLEEYSHNVTCVDNDVNDNVIDEDFQL